MFEKKIYCKQSEKYIGKILSLYIIENISTCEIDLQNMENVCYFIYYSYEIIELQIFLIIRIVIFRFIIIDKYFLK